MVEAPQENPNWAQIVEQSTQDADVIYTVMAEQEFKAFLDALSSGREDHSRDERDRHHHERSHRGTGGAKSPLKGGVSTGFFPPPQDKAWADFRKGMQKYAKNTQLEPAGQKAWLAIQLAAQIMKSIDGPVTAESFVAAVDATTDDPHPGRQAPAGKELPEARGDLPPDLQQRLLGPVDDQRQDDWQRQGSDVRARAISADTNTATIRSTGRHLRVAGRLAFEGSARESTRVISVS